MYIHYSSHNRGNNCKCKRNYMGKLLIGIFQEHSVCYNAFLLIHGITAW